MSFGRIARNALWNILGQILPIVVAVVAVPMLIRAIGLDRFGFLSLAWALIGYAGLFDLGVSRALTRAVAERLAEGDQAGAAHVARVGTSLMFLFGSTAGVLLFLASPWIIHGWLKIPEALQPESVAALQILSVSIPVVLLMAAYRGVLDACHAFKAANIVRIVMGLFTYAGPLAVTVWSSRLEWVVASVVVMRVVSTWWHAVLCRQAFQAIPMLSRMDKATVKSLLGLGGWITVSNVVSPLMAQLDRVILGGLVPVKWVGYYATPFDMITRALTLPYAFMAVLFPVLAGSHGDRVAAQQTYAASIRVLFMTMLPITFSAVVLARPLIELWLGADFATHSTVVLQVLAFGVLANTLAQAPANLIQGMGNPKWMAILHVLELPAFLAALYALTKAHGINGAALSWTLRMVLDAAMLFAMARWRLFPTGLSVWRISLAGVLSGALMGAGFVPKVGSDALLVWVIGLIGCGLISWFLILTSSDKSRMAGLISARLGRMRTEAG